MEAATPEMIPPTLFGLSDFSADIRVVRIRCGLSQFAAITSKFPRCVADTEVAPLVFLRV